MQDNPSHISEPPTHLYTLIEPISSELVGLFVQERPEFSQIVGYSALGHVFLYNPSEKEYAVFYPHRQAAKSYGSFKSITSFEEDILKESSFSVFVLKSTFTKALIEKHGSLKSEEVFIPTPYFHHQSENVNDFSKGNIWVMLDLIN